jgi:hypothetical protein
MTIFKLLSAALVFLLASSCKDKQTAAIAPTMDTAEIKEYFPVYDFLLNEKRGVDSMAVGLKYYVRTNQKTDSGYITHTDFDKLVALVLSEGLMPQRFKKDFRETSFYDQSMKTSTFMYQSLDTSNPVKRVDILTKATDTYDKVSSIYIESLVKASDSAVLNKMIWQTGRSMQLNQQVNSPGKPAIERQIKVVWNNWGE